MFELDFFATHFLEGHRGIAFAPAERAALAEEFTSLASELSDEPRVVCHRDYHSRNLMVRDGRLAIIDFQDARLGPDTYDLVSLLRDSYVALSATDVDALIGLFLSLERGPLGFTGDAARFRERFDTMAVQRNLKALGTFGYQASVRRNPAYLDDVPRTLGYLEDTFARRPRFDRLRTLLAGALPELR
jgi:aminoglycoside/choline kinase family phosphotransferase